MAPKKKTIEEKYEGKTVVVGECLEWTAHLNRDGIPMTTINRKPVPVRRAYYIERIGDPGTMLVSNSCGNVKCVKPDHIMLTTDIRKQKPLIDLVEPDWSFASDADFMERFSSAVETAAKRKDIGFDDAFQAACIWLAARPDRVGENIDHLAGDAIAKHSEKEWKIRKSENLIGEDYGVYSE